MNEIMIKTYELIDVMNESDLIKELTYYKARISNDKKLQELILEGNNSSDKYKIIDIKRRLYQNKDYNEYMKRYNLLIDIVREINYRYKEVIGEGGCFK